MSNRAVCLAVVCILSGVLFFSGCSDDSISPPVSIDLTLGNVSEHSPLVFILAAAADPESAIEVKYWSADTPALSKTSVRDSDHEVVLARLISDTTYEFEVSALRDPDGEHLTGSFQTGPLPERLQALKLTSTGQSTAALTMLEVRMFEFNSFVAVDSWGRIVWYYRTEGSSYCWTQRGNGNFVVNDPTGGVREITPLGELVAALPPEESDTVHHEILARPDGSVWMLQTVEQEFDGKVIVGDKITRWVPESGELVELWNSFDFLSPIDDWGEHSKEDDWLHLNSLRVGASGNVLISSPFLNQVIAISPDFSALVWRMGGPNATIIPTGGATFAFQHTAAEPEPGRVVVFDNRGSLASGGTWSRGLEVVINRAATASSLVWEFRPPNDNYASIMSAAYRVQSGNTVVAFGPGDGLLGSVGPIEVYEVSEDGRIVWHLLMEDLYHMYRGTPFATISGETQVLAGS